MSSEGGKWANTEWMDAQIKEFGKDTMAAKAMAAAEAEAVTAEAAASGSKSTSEGATKSQKTTMQPVTPGGKNKKRNRSGGSKNTGLTPEAKSRALGDGKTVSVKAKKAATKDTKGAAQNEESSASEKKKTKVELRVFGEQDGKKADLTRTLWRKVKDEFNRAIAAKGDLALLDGLIKTRHNVSDKKEGKEYGVFVYEEEQQIEMVSNLLLELDLNFDFQMKMVGSAKVTAKARAAAKVKAKAAKPTIEMKMLTNKGIPETELFNVIVKQNKLVGRMSRSKKDYGAVRVYTITPDNTMMEDIRRRKLKALAFGLDSYAIVSDGAGGDNECEVPEEMEQN